MTQSIPDPQSFLAAVNGYVQGERRSSADRPNRLAVIDPAFSAASYPGTLPKVTFEGETALSGKRYAVLGDYIPAPGDRVLMVPVGNTYVIMGALSLGAWIPYTPTWTGTTTNPTLGDGSWSGTAYRRVGKTVQYRGFLVFGASTTPGNGTWDISLPVTATSLANSAGGIVGSAWLRDSGVLDYAAACRSNNSTSIRFQYGTTLVTHNAPFAWGGASDRLSWFITYEAA